MIETPASKHHHRFATSSSSSDDLLHSAALPQNLTRAVCTLSSATMEQGRRRCFARLPAWPHRRKGTLAFSGKSPQDGSRDLGYMAHPSLLYDEMSGMENLRYFARLYGIDGDQRCEEVIRAVGLDPDLARPVGQYSQGMRQRMSLARAILHDPEDSAAG